MGQEFRPEHVHASLESKVQPLVLQEMDLAFDKVHEELRLAAGHLA